MSKQKLLIYGAGAIGRGYMPWVYPPNMYDYYYVESNTALRQALNERKKFTSFKAIDGSYEELIVPVVECFAPGDEIETLPSVAGVITCVGPRNFSSLQSLFRNIRVPVICCENDANLPLQMREQTGNPNIVFAIPDVITSSTASYELLRRDPLALITEVGTFFCDEHASSVKGNCSYVSREELAIQWAAKLYIHNTPHCIAAYLGNILGVRYLHETMQCSAADTIVEGAMLEMESMLQRSHNISHEFLSFYSQKELSRFRNHLLYDPIARVAREPFRKLAHNDRLIGAAQRCLSNGIVPKFLMLGIMVAFYFDSSEDPDSHIKYLIHSLRPEEFLSTIIRLRESEALFDLLLTHWNSNIKNIAELKNEQREAT
jgi:mannitol-1-phosphate 5-dehydrogenase